MKSIASHTWRLSLLIKRDAWRQQKKICGKIWSVKLDDVVIDIDWAATLMPFSNINYLQSYLIPSKYPLCSKLNFHVDCACDSILQAMSRQQQRDNVKMDFYSLCVCVKVHEEFGSKCKLISIHTIKHNFLSFFFYWEREFFNTRNWAWKSLQNGNLLSRARFQNYRIEKKERASVSE